MRDVYHLAPVNKLAALVTSQAEVTDDFLLRTIDLNELYKQCTELLESAALSDGQMLRIRILRHRAVLRGVKELRANAPRLFEGVAVGDKFKVVRKNGKSYCRDIVSEVSTMHFRGSHTGLTYSIRSGKASGNSRRIAVPINRR